MSETVFCPTCGSKVCETAKSKNLKVKCKKCKNNMIIDKDEAELRVLIVDKNISITARLD